MKINKPKQLIFKQAPITSFNIGDYLYCHCIPEILIPSFIRSEGYIPFTVENYYEIYTYGYGKRNCMQIKDDVGRVWVIKLNIFWRKTKIETQHIFKLIKTC